MPLYATLCYFMLSTDISILIECSNAPNTPLLSQTFVFFLMTLSLSIFFMKVVNKPGVFGALEHYIQHIYPRNALNNK